MVGSQRGLLVVALIALLLSLPLVLDSESFKAAALRHLARATGGQWQVARLDFTWLPTPTVSIQGASFSIPGSAQGKVEALTLTTALLPLLWGDVRLSRVALVAPDITITVGPSPPSTGPSGTFTVSDLRALLTGAARVRTVDLDSLDFVIERGRFVLSTPEQPDLTFSGISGHAVNHSGRFDVQLSTASDLAQRIDVKVDLDAVRFAGAIQLDAIGIDLATLLAVAGVEGTVVRSTIALRASIKADSTPALKGTFQAHADGLTIDSSAGKLALEGVALDGEAVWTDAGLRLVGQDVRTAAPAVQATAVLTFSPDWNQQRLEARVEPAELETVKQLALPWTTGTPQVERYARMITAGHLSGVEATLQLDQIDQWQKAIEVRGTLSGAAMTLKRPELPIRDLTANLALVQGKLQARDVKAVSGNSSLHDGRIDLDFTTTQTAVNAAARWQADLAQALAFTKRQLAPEMRAKLDTLRELTGNAHGSVALDGTFDRLKVDAQVDAIHAQASLEQLPWPVTVADAKVRFDGSDLAVQGLAGKLGDSAFGRCSGRITLAAAAQVQVSGCEADLALVELFDWASRRFGLPDAMKDLRLLAGRASVQVRTLAGALAAPAKWTGDVSVTPKAVRLTHPEVPDELRLDGGSVHGDLRALTAQGIKVEVLDAALQLGGNVSDLTEGKPQCRGASTAAGRREDPRVDLGPRRAAEDNRPGPSLRGAQRAAVAGGQWLRGRRRADVRRQDECELRCAGSRRSRSTCARSPSRTSSPTCRCRCAGARVCSKAVSPGHWLAPRSSGSCTSGSRPRRARRQPEVPPAAQAAARLQCERNPAGQPADRAGLGPFVPVQIDVQERRHHGERPYACASHFLLGRRVELRRERHDPRHGSALCVRPRRQVRSRRPGNGCSPLWISRPARRPPSRVPAAADVMGSPDRRQGAAGHPGAASPSLRDQAGTRDARHLTGSHQLRGQGSQAVRHRDGRGRTSAAETVSLDVVLRARDIDPRPTLLCLTQQRTALTGRLDADAHFTGSGPYRELGQRMHGPFHLVARDGRVDRMTALARILNLVNASELLRGKNLGLPGSGFAYNKFVATRPDGRERRRGSTRSCSMLNRSIWSRSGTID